VHGSGDVSHRGRESLVHTPNTASSFVGGGKSEFVVRLRLQVLYYVESVRTCGAKQHFFVKEMLIRFGGVLLLSPSNQARVSSLPNFVCKSNVISFYDNY
jgi:hypothetical protein